MELFGKDPFLRKGNQESISKPEPMEKPKEGSKKLDLVKGSWLEGGEVGMDKVKRYFRRPDVRSDLRRRFKIPQNDTTQLDKHIQDMMEMVPNRFQTGVIDQSEVTGSEFQREKHWGLKHDIDKKREDGLTKEELIDIDRHKEKLDYIEEKFGK